MTKMDKALDRLIKLVAKGVEFPDAHCSTIVEFNLGPKESELLIENYDWFTGGCKNG